MGKNIEPEMKLAENYRYVVLSSSWETRFRK